MRVLPLVAPLLSAALTVMGTAEAETASMVRVGEEPPPEDPLEPPEPLTFTLPSRRSRPSPVADSSLKVRVDVALLAVKVKVAGA